ncbi:hypothetical protein DNTS_005283 [Danionella cerebrum]|uniref:LRRCT domain-containing protein n=1 Tax=Danionella cerebrum TaxID=2873325 RepID=A0A553R8T4_9TELE|nr:hypothetical protein DNTS_005283 [Danionella translucida]
MSLAKSSQRNNQAQRTISTAEPEKIFLNISCECTPCLAEAADSDPRLLSTMLLFLVLGSVLAQGCSGCQCGSVSSGGGLQVNCSGQGLLQLPQFPASATELLLQNNQLTTIPPGMFDSLPMLRRVQLSGNPLHCDCSTLYLTHWLQMHSSTSGMPTCASPPELALKPVADLMKMDLPSCSPAPCPGWLYNLVLSLALVPLNALLLWCVRLARDSTFILGIDERHSGLEMDSLRSLRPKHRVRVRYSLGSLTTGSDEQDRPLLNMDILPQILDVLHKQHNIKIKTP